MASIAGMLPSDVNVLRDGRQMTMPAKDLVVGDLVYVSLGDKVSSPNPHWSLLMIAPCRSAFHRSLVRSQSRPICSYW
jgi:sodium/potassium-transporting ATPase subunit alpha